MTKAKKIRVELDRKVAYELDGGDARPAKVLKVEDRARRDHRSRAPAAVTIASRSVLELP